MTIRELLKDLKLSNLNTQIVLKDSIYISNKNKDELNDDILDKEIGYWMPVVNLEEGSWVMFIVTKEWCTKTYNKEGHSNDC